MGDGYLGRYRLDELLGSGGSAEVWRAHDTVTDRTVALKVLAPVLTADPEYRERFEREARAASLLHGPHVVAVHTYGELEGRLFIESEFVDGLDIEALLEWEGPMTPDTAVELIAQVASALDEAHAAGLVHRDVKPQNIIVAPDDIAYLIDFGTAFQDGQTAITQTGMLVGTPAYMAPERFDGTISVRSDVYSLACVLYECLTGQRAFRVRNPAQLMRAHLERMPEPPSSLAPAVPAALDRVIARGLAKQPAERYATAGEFAAAARAALAESVAAAADPSVAATEIAAAAVEPGSATTEPIAAAAEPVAALAKSTTARPDDQVTMVIPAPSAAGAAERAAARRGASASGVDTRTVVLPMNSVPDTTPPPARWTRRRRITAAGFAAAAITIALSGAWITGNASEPGPARTRVPAENVAKTPVPASIPPTEQPVQLPETLPPTEPSAPVASEPEPTNVVAPMIPPPVPAWTLPNIPDLSKIPKLDLGPLNPDPRKPSGGHNDSRGPRGQHKP
ncbi:serine/threonine-protein kinase [Nocardia tengchongensis]|uniref:serine/threonine-protein kinase n=1 Tax=Nocardia tengchongensis TaxID=2055889 RepID=UPI00364F7CC5